MCDIILWWRWLRVVRFRRGLGIFVPVAVLAFLSGSTPTFALPEQVEITVEQPFVDVPIYFEQSTNLRVELNSYIPCSNWVSGVHLDAFIRVFNSDGVLVAQDDDGNFDFASNCLASLIDVSLPTGHYVVRFSGCCSGLTGTGFVVWGAETVAGVPSENDEQPVEETEDDIPDENAPVTSVEQPIEEPDNDLGDDENFEVSPDETVGEDVESPATTEPEVVQQPVDTEVTTTTALQDASPPQSVFEEQPASTTTTTTTTTSMPSTTTTTTTTTTSLPPQTNTSTTQPVVTTTTENVGNSASTTVNEIIPEETNDETETTLPSVAPNVPGTIETERNENPSVFEQIKTDQVMHLLKNIEISDLSEDEIEQLISVLNEAPEEVKKEFESAVNVFGGNFDSYVPSGSTISVGQRRVLIVVTALTMVIPAPVARKL